MEQFFKNKARTFWFLQILGWIGYGVLRVFQGLTIEGELTLRYLQLAGFAMVLGFFLTLFMRIIYRRVRSRSMLVAVLSAVSVSTVFGLLFSSIEVTYFLPGSRGGLGLLGNAMFEFTALFAWSVLYFGFHYYNDLQEQRSMALAANAMAQEAQLKMLRYQLNPHFLFNTLNAISTLVLEKNTKTANMMLTKLSSFLRYTLVNQPNQKVTLQQELDTLALYLEIEKVRFEDRLKIVYDIDQEVRDALIPSLILQPHIENAIKYAIAPSIDGGTLKICSHRDGRYLIVRLEDDGPGMENPDKPISTSSSGVGIVNTRDRLNQIYGKDHALLIQNIQPTGLRVWFKIPFETEDKDE